jgi:hypothetical protein
MRDLPGLNRFSKVLFPKIVTSYTVKALNSSALHPGTGLLVLRLFYMLEINYHNIYKNLTDFVNLIGARHNCIIKSMECLFFALRTINKAIPDKSEGPE